MQDKNNRLLRNLVSEIADKSSQPGKVSFITAMQQMSMTSVFDIIGQSKPRFVERLGEICDADGALAYDNAMCYAVQIGGLYREHRVSSGKPQDLTQRTGVRALVDVGPSYPNLFKENWDEFCKVGAIAALDSPVAYLSSLYQFATRTLETSGQGDRPKILLGKRRPDIASLVIDQQSTFTPRPMLELVNGILKEDIQRYRKGKPDENKPVYELLAERRYPFIFPYHFAHHQCRLGLAKKKLGLGVLNYLISREVPATQGDRNVYGAVQNASLEAQRLLSGLSPQQQQLLIEPSLFTTFHLSKAELAAGWKGPGTSHLRPHKALGVGFLLLPGQASIKDVEPEAHYLISNPGSTNVATIVFSKADSPEKLELVSFNSGTPARSDLWSLNHLHQASPETMCPRISWGGNDSAGYRASFTITTTSGSVTAPLGVAALSVTLMSDEILVWSVEQQGFFQKHYGLESNSIQLDQSLIDLKTFMQRTGLDAQQVEAVLSQRTHFPRLSPNCPSTNPQFGATGIGAPYPHASHFGACYVNGHGSGRYDSVTPATATSIRKDQFDNSMGLTEVLVGARKTWRLTKTSPNRFDRLQRMIRLQRWLEIPFAELDTLIISAIRSEGEHNLTMELNLNTLRALGVYRYLAQRYKLEPLEFAAFLHDLTPYATGDDVPLFDQVFNEVTLFDVPLVLDQQVFNARGADVASKRTVAQLCAGLGLQPSELSFLRLAGQTQEHVGPLKRDLETVSSVYRQARVPQMFGLSAEDGWALMDLLGGQDYQRLLCTGRLSQQFGQSLKPIYIKAAGGSPRIEITLALVVDPVAAGDSLRLLPGSMLSVEMGSDFAHTDSALREFTFEFSGPEPKIQWFLTNADDSQLTLDPVEVGGSLSLTGKKIIRAGWEAINNWSAKPISYLRVRCGQLGGRLLELDGITEGEALTTPPDILDLLMQMDWAVTWLKDSKQSVTDVRRLLGLDPGDYLPPQGLIDRLAKLALDTRAAVITDQQIEALNLPTHEAPAKGRGPGDDINWRTVLLPLLDERGMVKDLPLELIENTQGQLSAALVLALKPLRLEPEARARSLEKLGTLLLVGHDRQLRLIEGLTQEMVNLPMDRTQVVVRWAGTSVYELLSAVLQTDADAGISSMASLLEQIRSMLRHAEAALHLRLGTSALRLFLVHPEWLGAKGGTALSWASFYLLGRYSQWLGSQSQTEEALLGYFIAANPAKVHLKNKALRSAVNDESAEALANLLGWSVQEVSRLFQELPQGRACSMAEVDWILRCQGASKASGMTAADVLAATALHADSAPAAWQAVGEAAVAASR
jgi:hypothetical protein